MPLPDAFSAYLRDRRNDEARGMLAATLEGHGYRLEARLLERWGGELTETEVDLEGSPWSGRRAWVGSVLPPRPRAGDIWLDTCELTPMLLLPRKLDADPSEYAPGVLERLTPFVAWLALRPVATWQFVAFLDLARTVSRQVQIPPRVEPLDAERILAGRDDDAPVTSVMPEEARLYATWFGKGMPDREDWQAATAALSPEELAALWGSVGREWNGAVTEGVYAVVTPETIEIDPREVLDEDPPLHSADRILYGELETPSDVTFRTHVSTQVGLRTGSDPLSILDVDVVDGADRD